MKLVVWLVAIFSAITLGLFGFDMYSNPLVYGFLAPQLVSKLGIALMLLSVIPIALLSYRMSGGPAPAIPEMVHTTPVTQPPPPAPSEPPQEMNRPIVPAQEWPHLLGLSGGLPTRIEISGPVFIIGRAPDCQLILSSQMVSRHHAQLLWNGETLLLRDLGSSNSTLVNGREVEGERTLDEGDIIAVLDYTLEVELPPSMARTIKKPRQGSEPEVDPNATVRMTLPEEG